MKWLANFYNWLKGMIKYLRKLDTWIKIMSTKLARDDRQSVMQVGSYNTDAFQNITTATPEYVYDTVARVKSYGGDNWISRGSVLPVPVTLENADDPGKIIDVTGFSVPEWNLSYTHDSSSSWTNGLRSIFWYTTGEFWVMTDSDFGDTWISETSEFKFPHTTWVSDYDTKYPGSTPASGTIGEFAITPDDPVGVVGEGLLLAEGEELTMLIYQGDIVATTGGTLNIVPVAK
jgi:hypothetical protein